MLTVNDTVQSYSGKSGCMCGCNGTYNDSERARKMAITRLLKRDWEVDDFGRVSSDGVAGCIFVDNGDRNNVLYLTKEGVEKAKALKEETVVG